MQPVQINEIIISPDRQRRFFDMAKIVELANSIQQLGLLQPIVLDGTNLVAGERRLRACTHLTKLGVPIRCNGVTLDPGLVPTLQLTDSSGLNSFDAQFDENDKRESLTWQERAAAVEQRSRILLAQNPATTITDITESLTGSRLNTGPTYQQISVAKHLEDKEIAAAPSLKEALKILQKREDRERRVALGAKIDSSTLSQTHCLLNLDFRLSQIEPNTVDVILTDPPYGMAADGFKDGGGAVEVLHQYDDIAGPEWEDMMKFFYDWAFKITKPEAHVYMFCDIDKFPAHRDGFARAGFKPFRTPFIWTKSHASSRRVPWPDSGPRRGYEVLLYAVKGARRVTTIKSDVIGPFQTDANLGHAAQKPVELYTELLSRSVEPGNVVLDAFCGTGPIFPAAQALKCRGIGFEIDTGFYSIAAERLAQLKDEEGK
jgi:DNA modification methylase/ParB-like chromosome segregation protein Spo0J